MKWLKVKEDQIFCPKCLNGKKIIFKITNSLNGFKSMSSDNYYLYKCKNCDWKGNSMDLISLEEWKNMNRVKLIEEMLND